MQEQSNSGTGNWILAAILVAILVFAIGEERTQRAQLDVLLGNQESLEKDVQGDVTSHEGPPVAQEEDSKPEDDSKSMIASDMQEPLKVVEEIRNLGDNLKQEYQQMQALQANLRQSASAEEFQTKAAQLQELQKAFESGRQIYTAKVNQALQAVRELASQEEATRKSRLAYAFLLGESGENEAKVKMLLEEAEREALDTQTTLDLVMTMDQMNRMEDSRDLLKNLLETRDLDSKEKMTVMNMLAQQHFWLEEFDQAIALYDQIMEDPRFAQMVQKPRANAVEYKKVKANELQYRKEDENLPTAEIHTNKGVIQIELFEDDAPNGVANFITLAESGVYDNQVFHRVIPKFMAQVGDPLSKDEDPSNDGTGGPGYTIKTELNRRKHLRGSLSWANAGLNTDGSQFFLTVVPTFWLNEKHAVFGRIVKGMDVVDSLEKGDRMQKVVITSKRDHEYTVKKNP